MCKNCGNSTCGGGCQRVVITKRGERGPAGTSALSYVHRRMVFQANFNTDGGYPLIEGEAFLMNGLATAELEELQMSGLLPGEHILMFETVITSAPVARTNFNYEIRKNGTVIPYSTRTFRVLGGTPGDESSVITLNIPVGIASLDDIITVWVRKFNAESALAFLGGSLTAIKV